MKYDDEPTSCPGCSIGLTVDALCDCDDGPMCVRCHQIQHVEHGRWAERKADVIGDELMRRALSTWGTGDVA